jgi:hypothetical protein
VAVRAAHSRLVEDERTSRRVPIHASRSGKSRRVFARQPFLEREWRWLLGQDGGEWQPAGNCQDEKGGTHSKSSTPSHLPLQSTDERSRAIDDAPASHPTLTTPRRHVDDAPASHALSAEPRKAKFLAYMA